MALLDMIDPPVQYDPAVQGLHSPSCEKNPGMHAHDAGLGDPSDETEPAGQVVWTPALQYEFAGHGTHTPLPM